MLVLARRSGERTIVDCEGHRILIQVKQEANGKIKLAFVADKSVVISREEVLEEEDPNWEEGFMASLTKKA